MQSLLLTAPIARRRVSTRTTFPSTTPHGRPKAIEAIALAVYGPIPVCMNMSVCVCVCVCVSMCESLHTRHKENIALWKSLHL